MKVRHDSPNIPSFSYLLLSLQGAWAAVIIQRHPTPIRTGPRTSPFLPCRFSLDPPRQIDPNILEVRWSLRDRTVIRFAESVATFRPRGAYFNLRDVPHGDAGIHLPDVRQDDTGVYICAITHPPDSAEGEVTLILEARPYLSLGPPVLPPGKRGNLTCAASNFYPAGISVKWLRNGEVVKDDSPPSQIRPNHHFYAESVLSFTPQISDHGVTFSCHVRHRTSRDPFRRDLVLKVRVAPRLSLGLTDAEVGEPSNLMCVASDFYPGNVSVSWLRDGEILKTDSPPVQEGPDGLFFAQSVLEFTPQISDAGVIFSCHIHHEAAKKPISEDFELKVKARPEIHMVPRPPVKTFLVIECLACGFYPQKVKVKWLQNGEPIKERIYDSEIIQNPNRTFSTGSIFFPPQGQSAANYTCQVLHETLDAPLEETVPWEPQAGMEFGSPKDWALGISGNLLGFCLGIGVMCIYLRRKSQAAQAAQN